MCERCKRLETELLRRPQLGDLQHVRERIARKERMYEVVLARNTILKRRLDEALEHVRMLERESARDVVSARATTQEEKTPSAEPV